MEQIARTELDVERVRVLPADTAVGSAGSTSASRQTWMSGGAVRMACLQVAQRLRERAAGSDAPLEILLADEPIDETAVYRHRPTAAARSRDRAGRLARGARLRRPPGGVRR